MKILIFGSNSKWAIETAFIEHLEKENEIIFYNGHGIFINFYHNNFLNKLTYRLGISMILKRINKEFLNTIHQELPDAILVFKGMELFPKTLKKINALKIPLLNYNPDHPFQFASKGSGNKNVIKGIKFYNHHFSYSTIIVSELKKKFGVSASWLPFAYRVAAYPKKNPLNKVCFIGNADKYRSDMISLLLKNGISVDVYGRYWQKFISHHDFLNINAPVYSDDFKSISQKYRIQLNFFRAHNHDSHNMRTFEMPALGCIMLSPFSSEQIKLFEEKKEAYYYNDDNDFVEKCKEIINLSEEQAYKVQINAYERCIHSNYSYFDRCNQVIQKIKELVV